MVTDVSEFLELVDLVLEGGGVFVVVAGDGVSEGGNNTDSGRGLEREWDQRRLRAAHTMRGEYP